MPCDLDEISTKSKKSCLKIEKNAYFSSKKIDDSICFTLERSRQSFELYNQQASKQATRPDGPIRMGLNGVDRWTWRLSTEQIDGPGGSQRSKSMCFMSNHDSKALLCECYFSFIQAMLKSKVFSSLIRLIIYALDRVIFHLH